jgi:hypothetical protein
LYEEKRVWSTYSPVIINSIETDTKYLDIRDNNCYYKINPFDLDKMDYTLPDDLDIFRIIYMSSDEFQNNTFEIMCATYNNLAIEHQTKIIEEEIIEEIAELTAFFEDLEDKKNITNLITLYNKGDMNNDLLMIIYNNLLSADGIKKYEYLMTELGTHLCLEGIS